MPRKKFKNKDHKEDKGGLNYLQLYKNKKGMKNE